MIKTEATSQEPANSPLPGLYRHYKGSDYQVLGMARHSETEEWLVVYQALYAERGFWLRPLSLWLEPVNNTDPADSTAGDAAVTERFTLLEANERSLSAAMKTG